MSRWERWSRYQPAPKHPPPRRGIKMKKTGSTWWGQLWVEALERMSLGYSSRLARGRTYARAGRTHDLVVEAGEVTARVTGSRATPYQVRITLRKLPKAAWTRAIAAMAGKAQFAAELLAGQMPHAIESAFEEAGASLFPAGEADLVTSCSCPDWANPCKHVAATHYVLGEALDRDPFLLFELRGRTKDQVLAALRAARAGRDDASAPTPARRGGRKAEVEEDEVPSVSLDEIDVAGYDQPREPPPALHLSFETPPVSGAVLRQLGTPAAWSSGSSPAEMLAPLLRAAAQEARRLALHELERVEEADPANVETVDARSRASAKHSAKKAPKKTPKKATPKKATIGKPSSAGHELAGTGRATSARARGRRGAGR